MNICPKFSGLEARSNGAGISQWIALCITEDCI